MDDEIVARVKLQVLIYLRFLSLVETQLGVILPALVYALYKPFEENRVSLKEQREERIDSHGLHD